MHPSLEHFLDYLRELDPQDIVAELDLSSEKLVELLEDYVYDYYFRADQAENDGKYELSSGEETDPDSA